MDIYEILEARKVPFERHGHPAAVSCEDADKVIPFFEGAARTKSLFLRDAKGKRHFLVVLTGARKVDFDALSETLQAKRLGMASPERLKERLGLEPGCLSLLAILKDADRKVELAIDEDVLKFPRILCHPWVNTMTLILPTTELLRLLEEEGRSYTCLKLP